MSDLHSPLDREAARIDSNGDALERIRKRAARNRQRRRVLAAAVSLVIGGAGVGLAYTAFSLDRGAQLTPRAGSTPTNLPVWPDGPAPEIDRIQQSVDEGHQPWYLSPRLVAEVFAMEVMHWDREDIRVDAPDEADEHATATATISNPALASEAGTPDVPTVLEMQRWRGRPGGILVITSANSEAFIVERPLQYEDFESAPGFDVSLRFVPEGLLGVGAWKHDLSGLHAFTRPRERFQIDLRASLGWSSHPIASVRLIHAPGFWSSSDGPVPFRDAPVLALTAHRLGQYTPAPQPSPTVAEEEGPVPGPTPTSDGATPDPVEIQIDNATTVQGAAQYAADLLASEGRGVDHGGYRTEVIRQTEGSEVTLLFCDPRYVAEAERLRDLFFLGAEIRDQLPDDPIAVRIVLGEDFALRESESIRRYLVAVDFLEARNRGRARHAKVYLAPAAELAYESRTGGLSLLEDYSHGRSYEITGLTRLEDGDLTVVVLWNREPKSDVYESLTVGPEDETVGYPQIFYAERNS